MAKKKSAAKSSKTDASPSKLSFEEALEQLQTVVGTLEQGKLSLSDSLKAYENGISLLRACYGELENAEQRIRVLTEIDEQGRVVVEDFDGSSTFEQLESGSGTRRGRAALATGTEADSDTGEGGESEDWESEEADSQLDDDSDEFDSEGRLF